MKRAQTGVIVVLLALVLVVLSIIAYALLIKPSTTGNVTKDAQQQNSCVPQTCESIGLECGNVNNGCGTLLTCGPCRSGEDCVNGHCKNIDNSENIINSCTLSAPLGCRLGVAEILTDGISLEVVNGAGEDIAITNVKIQGCGEIYPEKQIIDSANKIFWIPCSLQVGAKFSGSISITFKTAGTSLQRTSSGEVIGRVH